MEERVRGKRERETEGEREGGENETGIREKEGRNKREIV